MNKMIITTVVVAVIAGGVFYSLRPEQSIESRTHEVVLRFEGGKLVQGPELSAVKKGDSIELTITADAEEEFHLHGYDQSTDVGPDKEPTLTFLADTAGRFVAELEGSKEEVWVLEVMP